MPAKKSANKATPEPAAPKAAKAPGKSAVKKAAAPKAPKAAATPPRPSRSHAEIAKAAYLNYRRRIQLGLPGDELSDWYQAAKEEE